MKKLGVLLFAVVFIACLYGCGGTATDYLGISNQKVSETKIVRIDDSGKLLAPIEFYGSGARFETPENNTLTENVVVTVTETKTDVLGINPIGNPDYIYLYDVSAELVDSLGNKTEVKTLEKPLKLTLKTSHLGREGICYAGIRNDSVSPWKYCRLSDDGSVFLSQRSIRASSSEKLAPSYILGLYNMGVQIALFAYNKPFEEAQKDISVTSIVATTTPLLLFDDKEKYLDDLSVDIKLNGDNLSGLSSSDISVSIIYRTNNSSPAAIKANGFACKQTTTRDDAVSGSNSFVHTLKVSSFDTTFGVDSELHFTLDLKGKNKSDFPTDFLLEISSESNIKELIPFSYSERVSFKTEKAADPEPDQVVYTIIYNLDGGSLAEGDTNPTSYSDASETFTLKNPVKDGFTFEGWTGTGLSVATKEVSIAKGSTGNREYTATWTENPPDTYTLTVVKGTGIATVSEGGAYEADKEITLEYILEAGYQFVNWTSDDVTVDATGKFTMPAKAVTVTANARVITYNITYAGLEDATFDVGVTNPEAYDVTSATITLNNPTKTGYTFKGWSGTELTGDENLTVTIAQGSTGDRTYTANWTLANYTITYNLDGGELSAGITNPASYDMTTATITLNKPIRTGCIFKGWSGTDLTGDENLTVIIAQGSTGDRTYTANWIPISYAISYDLDGGRLATDTSNPTSYDITSATITLNNPVKTGFSFLGWTGTDIASGTASETVTIPQGSTGERSYVASWTLAESVLTFNLSESVTLEMRLCPAGTFVRTGRDTYCDGKTVIISKGFYMGTYEVTNAQYEAIIGYNPSSFISSNFASDTQPVVNVSWAMITAEDGFIDRMNSRFASQLPVGYRFALPTEAQWEYACRAGTTTDLNIGLDISNQYGEDSNLNLVGWYNCHNNYKTEEVGQLAPNAFGLYDMHGNVFEWCVDWFDDYDQDNLTDPTGPSYGSTRVVRGGSYSFIAVGCSSWYRNSGSSSNAGNNLGFRLALVPVPTPVTEPDPD